MSSAAESNNNNNNPREKKKKRSHDFQVGLAIYTQNNNNKYIYIYDNYCEYLLLIYDYFPFSRNERNAIFWDVGILGNLQMLHGEKERNSHWKKNGEMGKMKKKKCTKNEYMD